jgi:putative transposase
MGSRSPNSSRSCGCGARWLCCGRSATSRSLLREGSEMRFAFIAKQRSVWPVSWLCEALDVSRSGFHAWLHRGPSARAQFDEQLTAKVRTSFVGSARTYGARRVWRDVLAEGAGCGLHKIERVMRANAFRARPRRRGLPKDDGQRSPIVVPNVLDRQFAAERPNQKWIADFRYVWTAEGCSTSPPSSTSSREGSSAGR